MQFMESMFVAVFLLVVVFVVLFALYLFVRCFSIFVNKLDALLQENTQSK